MTNIQQNIELSNTKSTFCSWENQTFIAIKSMPANIHLCSTGYWRISSLFFVLKLLLSPITAVLSLYLSCSQSFRAAWIRSQLEAWFDVKLHISKYVQRSYPLLLDSWEAETESLSSDDNSWNHLKDSAAWIYWPAPTVLVPQVGSGTSWWLLL